ncbi:MAG: hypothetical protein U1F57_09010 [bacterium]
MNYDEPSLEKVSDVPKTKTTKKYLGFLKSCEAFELSKRVRSLTPLVVYPQGDVFRISPLSPKKPFALVAAFPLKEKVLKNELGYLAACRELLPKKERRIETMRKAALKKRRMEFS